MLFIQVLIDTMKKDKKKRSLTLILRNYFITGVVVLIPIGFTLYLSRVLINLSSKLIPQNINPYQYPWVSSHLKTFKVNVFKKISKQNFQDLDNKWFERGYDQALYLPILFLARKSKYLNEICYLYRINSNSLKVRSWKEKNQLDTIKLVRARGFVL